MNRLRLALLAAALGGGSLLAAPAPAAEGWWGTMCSVQSFQNETATGQNYEGMATGGPVVFTGDVPGTLRCYVTVNDVPAAAGSTPLGTGSVASTFGPISYEAADGAQVKVCTEVNGVTVSCDDLVTFIVPVPVPASQRTHKPSHAQSGGGKKKDPNGTDIAPSPGASLSPTYPRGTIEISANGTGIVNVAYRNFDPPIAQWTCPAPSGTTATCMPPPAPVGFVNVCDDLTVAAHSIGSGTVTGISACGTGTPATAVSTGPTATPSTGASAPHGEFPWTCSADPDDATIWTVTCTVGPS